MIGESNLSLEDKDGELVPISGEIGGMVEEERELLSEIIEQVNSVYGIELRDEDKYYLENVDRKMTENEEMTKVMLGNNSEDVKKDFYKDLFIYDINNILESMLSILQDSKAENDLDKSKNSLIEHVNKGFKLVKNVHKLYDEDQVLFKMFSENANEE